jgi:hypothetical protein
MKPLHLFLCLSALGILLTFAVQYLFFTDTLLQQTFGGQLAFERVSDMVALSKKWQWVGYLSIPVVVLLRVFYTSVFIYTGLFFADIATGFGRIFKIALWADFAFVLSGFSKLVMLLFFKEVSTLHDLQFQPLSVLELTARASTDAIFIYPLSLLNLFELGYFIVLAWLLKDLLSEEQPEIPIGYGKTFRLVGLSYGSGLILWVITVMFISINLT